LAFTSISFASGVELFVNRCNVLFLRMNSIPCQPFIEKLQTFEHDFEGDPRWDIIFSNGRRKWFYVVATFYNGTYSVSELLNDASPIQISDDGNLVKEEDNGFGSRSAYFDKSFWQKTNRKKKRRKIFA
jgi:hypothetical protein